MFADGLEEFDSSREVVQSLIEEYKVGRYPHDHKAHSLHMHPAGTCEGPSTH